MSHIASIHLLGYTEDFLDNWKSASNSVYFFKFGCLFCFNIEYPSSYDTIMFFLQDNLVNLSGSRFFHELFDEKCCYVIHKYETT